MSCKSAIYLVNSGNNTVTEGNIIPLGNIVRRFGQALQQTGTGVACLGSGYFKVTGVFTVVPSASGVVGVNVLSDGSVVQSPSQEYQGTAGEPVNLTVVTMVRNCGCDCRSFLEFELSNGSGTVTQSSVVVEKL